MKKYVIFILLLLAANACRDEFVTDSEYAEKFITLNSAGLVMGGDYIYEYNDRMCQKVMNAERMVLRYQDDDQSKFVHFEFSSFPMYMDYSSGAIEGRITFSSDGKTVIYAMSFVILKDEADKYWLWDMENRMGIIAEF